MINKLNKISSKLFSKNLILIMGAILFLCFSVFYLHCVNADATENAKNSVQDNTPVAKIGSTTYDDLHDALTSCKKGETVELLRDVTLTGEWTPVSNFLGQFNGANFTVSGLNITTGDKFLGMFSSLENFSKSKEYVVWDLTIDNANISTETATQYVGVLAGYIYGEIKDVSVTNATVNVPAVQYTGGIVGATDAEVDYCKVSNSTITGKDQVGGLCGYNACAKFNYCTLTNNTIVAKEERAGGMLGKANMDSGEAGYYSIIGNTISGGSATAPDYAGGIAGQIMGQMSNYDINDNNIDIKLYANKISPIGVLREGQSTAFTGCLAEKIINNSWSADTYDNETYIYTAEETGAGDQVIYGGPSKPVCKIGDTTYNSLKAALIAAEDNDTIVLLKDVELTYDATNKYSLDINKSNITIDGAGYTIKPDSSSAWNDYKLGGSKEDFGKYNLIIVSASNITISNLNVDIDELRGLSCLTTKGGSDILYSNIKTTGEGCGHYVGNIGNGSITFTKCNFENNGYCINVSNNNSNASVYINDCVVDGWNSFGALNKIVVNDTYFGSSYDDKNKTMAGFRSSCPTYMYNCTFCEDYTKGDDTSNYTYVGVGTGATTTIEFSGCTVEDEIDIQNIINYNNAFNSEDAAQHSTFIFDPIYDTDSKLVSGIAQTKDETKIPTLSGSSAKIKVRNAVGTTAGTFQSGVGAIFYAGKNATGSDLKITGGSFSTDPGKYLETNYFIKNSGDNDCPFEVTATEPETKDKVVVTEQTSKQIDESLSEEEKATVLTAVLNSEVTGVRSALKEDTETHEAILAAAIHAEGSTVTTEKIEEASLVEYEIKAVVVAEKCNEPTTVAGSITFKVSPVATITTHKNGSVTGRAENVAISNDLLNGEDITVVLGSSGVTPKQVIHTRSDGTKELFENGDEASYEDGTFYYNSTEKTITVIIRDFSEIKVTGIEEITKIKVDGTTITAKSYDGTTDANIALGKISGIAEGDDVTVTAVGQFADTNAGTNKKVSLTYKLSGKDVDKYVSPTNETLEGTINKRNVSLTSESATKVYDGTALTAKNVAIGLDGFITEEGATYDITGTQTSIGKSENTFTYKLNGLTKTENYNITTTYGTLEVTAANTDSKATSAATGDTNSLLCGFIALMLATGCATAFCYRKKSKLN